MYELEEDIIHYVFLAFEGMKRKKENIALSFHSIMVGIMLKNAGCDDKTVYVGYLHDIIEDTSVTYEDVLERYGKDIADSVLRLSEDKSIEDYVERKKDFIKKIEQNDENLILVEIADKLQNLSSDYEQYLVKGKNFLMTEAKNYEQLKWYYLELKRVFNEKIKNNTLLDRYNKITYEYFEQE